MFEDGAGGECVLLAASAITKARHQMRIPVAASDRADVVGEAVCETMAGGSEEQQHRGAVGPSSRAVRQPRSTSVGRPKTMKLDPSPVL